jgi:hypothetical protein
MPTFGFDFPMAVLDVPKEKREELVDLADNQCVIGEQRFFLRGCIEIAVLGYEEPFIWGAWAEVSEPDFTAYVTCPEDRDRTSIGPYDGHLSGHFAPYEELCENLKVKVVPREHGTRPGFVLEPADHLLYREQRQGLPAERVAEIYEIMIHARDA